MNEDSDELQPAETEEEPAEEEEDEEEDAGSDDDDDDGEIKEFVPHLPDLSSVSHLRDVGKDSICWKLSSAKTGNGVEQIRDSSTETYWQSDGVQQPHTIQVFFQRRVSISHVCLYLHFGLDESYTPKKVTVSAGVSTQDLSPAVVPPNKIFDFHEPSGWCILPLQTPVDPLDDDLPLPYARGFVFEICVLSMHQNGRDTHVRQVELYGPRRSDSMVLPIRRHENQQPEDDDDHEWEAAVLQLQTPFATIR